jgi:(R,R)-butanediol dehydrogenase / meso-butanediol dehydrogenase / diacetyl reductase
MRAAVVGDGGAFEVIEVEDPVPGPGELLLRVTACGLCGSDLKARVAMPAGTVMGHEFGGEVVDVGPGVEGWHVGALTAVLPVASCGQCARCQVGDVIHCASAVLIGLSGSPGGLAELAVVPAASSFELGLGAGPAHAALVEPFAVGLHTVDAVGVEPGDSVLVVGAGTVGLTSITWARQRGAASITVADPNPDRLDMAREFGATDTLTAALDAEQNRYDVAIECVGKPGLLDACIAAVRAKGRIVVAGVCAEQDPFWSMAALMKELTIRFAVYYTPDEFRTVVSAFATGSIEPGRLVARTVALESLPDAFVSLADGTARGKILIDPSEGGRLAQR